jgi:replicative DNA helicase
LERGEFVILAGRPSVGKSAAALQIARNIAESGVGVAFFSLEMAIEQLMMRLACSVAEIDSDLLRRGQITKDEETRFWQTMAKLQQLPIYWSCKPGISGFEVESEVAKLRLRRDIGLVVVDYIQLMASDGESQNIRVSRSSQSLAQIAKGSDVCVLGLSQLSRAIESRDSSEPRMSDLRDSGGLENDADKIIFLWRERGEGLTVEELKKPIRTPMSLAKNRNGVANVAFRTMLFQGKYSRFVQESHDTEPF